MLDATISDLTKAGVFRAVTPLQWGGLEVDPVSFYEAVIRLASGSMRNSPRNHGATVSR